ncbi:PPC domain-containing DNA-binding protein [Streptomyces sp. NPDC001407]|uniref:PPC domain-containing DNA-binding protein n=1 Tax=Streptomyces sp. NPDC001407 TaxID=3364573 RepID=UPI003688C75C
MRARSIIWGRSFVLILDHGEDFFTALGDFCREHEIRSAHIPTFIGGFRTAQLVGSCQPLADPEAPVWDEVTFESLEVLGGGTLAWDVETDRLAPHIHVAAGLKADSASGRTSHLLGATVQFVNELVVQEILAPGLIRRRAPDLYDVPLLGFDDATAPGGW